MLTGPEIDRRVALGDIAFDPPAARTNPNSVNLRLGRTLKMYRKHYHAHQAWERSHARYLTAGFWDMRWQDTICQPLDSAKQEDVVEWDIPEEGQALWPNLLYLGHTEEYTRTGPLIPGLTGRSGPARLGISTDRTAGFSESGFNGTWTLEITVVQAVIVYAGTEICQMFFHEPVGEVVMYKGSYQEQRGPKESQTWREVSGLRSRTKASDGPPSPNC